MDANWLHALQSANSEFLQSGSGATAETLQDMVRQLGKTPQQFGAVADGVTDDTAAIMAAHDALPAAGGRIYLPDGAYLATNLPFTKRVTFVGNGSLEDETATAPCRIIKKSTATGNLLTLSGFSSIVQGIAFIGQAGNAGDGIQIKGNNIILRDVCSADMGGVGVRIGHSDTTNCNNWTLDHVNCRSNTGDGLYIHSDDAAGTINANAGTAINVSSSNNGGAGVHLKNAQKNTFIGCHNESNGTYGIQLESAAGCQNNLFVGGDQEGNTTADVIVGTDASKNVFHNVGVLGTFTNNSATTYISDDRGVQLLHFGTVVPGTIATKFNKWYEEGTFTPQLFLGATELSAQGTPGTYGVQIGRYRRSGNWVDFTINITLTAVGAGGAGALTLRNLPYLPKNVSNYIPTFAFHCSEIAFTGHLSSIGVGNDRSVYLYATATTGARTLLTETALEATSNFTVSGCYECDDNG